MSSVESIVARSLRLIGVIDPRQSIQAADMRSGIEALNAMMRRWEANGLSLGWSDVDNPSDPLPVPPEAEQAISANLALTVAPEYQVEPSPLVLSMAIGGLNELRRDVKVASPLHPDRGVFSWGYDTRTDAFY